MPLLPVALLLAIVLVIVLERSPQEAPSCDALQIRGADISFTLQEESVGAKYSDSGVTMPLERILAARGATYVRLRVWVNPPHGYSDTRAALELARRAKAAGLKIFLNLHYSDFWADAKKQSTPTAWRGLDLPSLSGVVRDYTRRTVEDFARQGTPVDMIQIGNEVTNGMLWPAGQIYRQTGENWMDFVALLNAGIAGARDGNSDPEHRLGIVIHFDRGADNDGARYFFDRIFSAGVASFDAIGLSYYPFWHGTLGGLKRNLDDLAARYGKDLILVEAAYPWTLEGGVADLGVSQRGELPQSKRYPPTVAGQERFFSTLRRIMAEVPDRRGAGLFVFEPGWLPGVGWEPGAPDPWANLTMFDQAGQMLPALAVALAPPTTPC